MNKTREIGPFRFDTELDKDDELQINLDNLISEDLWDHGELSRWITREDAAQIIEHLKFVFGL